MNNQQRQQNQDRWPNVQFVEQKESVTIREAIIWAVLVVAFYATLGLFLGS